MIFIDFLKPDARYLFLVQAIGWETVIIDEAHRLKNTASDTRNAVMDLPFGWLLLLTGTSTVPCQTYMTELKLDTV